MVRDQQLRPGGDRLVGDVLGRVHREVDGPDGCPGVAADQPYGVPGLGVRGVVGVLEHVEAVLQGDSHDGLLGLRKEVPVRAGQNLRSRRAESGLSESARMLNTL